MLTHVFPLQALRTFASVIQQKFLPAIAGKVGLAGGKMTSAMKAVGCVGVLSNGPSRDLDEIRPMKFQYLLSGVMVRHGDMSVRAVNVPASVAGIDVAPGEILHVVEVGACKFPAYKLEAVLNIVRALPHEEGEKSASSKGQDGPRDLGDFCGHAYGKKEE